MTDEGTGGTGNETAAEITARIDSADDGELQRWAQDDRVTVARAAQAALRERQERPDTGRPPAEEVSQQVYAQVHGDEHVYNGDPEVLAAPQAAADAATADGGTMMGQDDDEDGGEG